MSPHTTWLSPTTPCICLVSLDFCSAPHTSILPLTCPIAQRSPRKPAAGPCSERLVPEGLGPLRADTVELAWFMVLPCPSRCPPYKPGHPAPTGPSLCSAPCLAPHQVSPYLPSCGFAHRRQRKRSPSPGEIGAHPTRFAVYRSRSKEFAREPLG